MQGWRWETTASLGGLLAATGLFLLAAGSLNQRGMVLFAVAVGCGIGFGLVGCWRGTGPSRWVAGVTGVLSALWAGSALRNYLELG